MDPGSRRASGSGRAPERKEPEGLKKVLKDIIEWRRKGERKLTPQELQEWEADRLILRETHEKIQKRREAMVALEETGAPPMWKVGTKAELAALSETEIAEKEAKAIKEKQEQVVERLSKSQKRRLRRKAQRAKQQAQGETKAKDEEDRPAPKKFFFHDTDTAQMRAEYKRMEQALREGHDVEVEMRTEIPTVPEQQDEAQQSSESESDDETQDLEEQLFKHRMESVKRAAWLLEQNGGTVKEWTAWLQQVDRLREQYGDAVPREIIDVYKAKDKELNQNQNMDEG